MKKSAVVVGGSNGIGLSIATKLMEQGYYIYIIDKSEPDENYIKHNNNYEYIKFDLADFDECIFEKLATDKSIEVLMITAGFGRVARFKNIDFAEIEKQFKVNTLSAIHIIKLFYERLLSKERFYIGVMVSIAGIVSSPLFSTYSASKGALTKFIEAVNIELEESKTENRILDVSPGSLKGTRFNGDKNDLSQIEIVSSEIIKKMMNSETLYIPDYDEIYSHVIERYRKDPHEFGLQSYNYKIEAGREDIKKRIKIGYLSGTFDLFHIGHLNLIKRAKEYCDYLIVGVHPSAAHKGKETFIPFEERKAIVRACRYVDRVVDSCPEDSEAWSLYKYDMLFVGSDYKGTERFNNYEKYFEDKDVEIVYFPYTESTSSSQIRSLIIKETNNDELKRK